MTLGVASLALWAAGGLEYAGVSRPEVGPVGPINAGCFAAGTLISTENGPKPIETIHAGDRVWAFDERTGKIELREVVRTFEKSSDSLLKLEIGTETIIATSEHPFWVQGRGWVPASKLSTSDLIKGLSGTFHRVTKVSALVQMMRVYNFEVADFHAYFVSQAQLLVHNSSIMPISVDQALRLAEQFMEPGVPIRTLDAPAGSQFIQVFTDANGQTITRRVGFDLNPASPHVQQLGPHLNLQTQINGVIQRTGTLADPHIPIDPGSIVPGDY